MGKKLKHICALLCAIQAFFAGVEAQSEARDLTDVLGRGFSFRAFNLDTALAAKAVAPAFSAGIAESLRQVPVASGAPSFIYRLNPVVDTYERLTSLPGPLFSERALTLGKGQFDLSIGYSFVDFSDLNGRDLNNIRSPALLSEGFDSESILVEQPPAVIKLDAGEEVIAVPVSLSLIRTRLNLQAHVIVPTLRYGLTNSWEISLSVPIVNTFLRVKNEVKRVVDLDTKSVSYLFTRDAQGNIKRDLGPFDSIGNPINVTQIPFISSNRPIESLSKGASSATGVGDIILRSKYYFWRSELGGAAWGLNLQLPSGEVRNFHGTDETHLSTFLYLSQVLWKRFEPRLNIGVDFNANDVDRSSFLYAVGGTLLIGTKLGLIVDFIGRNEFSSFPVQVPKEGTYDGVILNKASNSCTADQPCFIDLEKGTITFPFFPEKIKRNDIIDFSFGLRYALGSLGSIFFGGIIPMNDDGLRADFVPSGGVEFSF